MKHDVHICISDRGWILEELAHHLSSRLDYVAYSTNADSTASIQYYITYGARSERMSPIEVACFTHLEEEPAARAKFFSVAQGVESCICISEIYASLLREKGATGVSVISPGVDFDRYTPRLQIGIVGRTYHTGRKGEHIVTGLMKEPWLEFHFTGSGWPGRSRRLAAAEMPAFYRSLDYVLVPSLFEGGPLCVIEAMACGVPVIAPPVGFVPEIDNIINYETGNVENLRRVLRDLYEKKLALREKIIDRTWNHWAVRHDELFRRLMNDYSDRLTSGEKHSISISGTEEQSGEQNDFNGNIFIDITLSALNREKSATGMSRLEQEISSKLSKHFDSEKLYFVSYNDAHSDLVLIENDRHDDLLAGHPIPSPFFSGEYPGVADAVNDLSNSTLVVLGHGWYGNTEYTRALLNLKMNHKMALLFLVPDVIHLKFPHWFPYQEAHRTRQQFELMLSCADACICFSKTSAKDLSEFAAVSHLQLPTVHHITLGDSFSAHQSSTRSKNFPDELNEKPYVLFVSSIIFRKNHQMLINLWERLIRENGPQTPRLVFVGKVVRAFEETVERWKRNPAIKDHFLHFEDIPDDLLREFYKSCLFTVFPSLYEGWGLPVAESLAMGKVVIASTQGAVSEIAPHLIDLLDPLDINAWQETVSRYAFDENILKSREKEIREYYNPRQWKTTVEDVASAINADFSFHKPGHSIEVGSRLGMSNALPHLIRTGWHRKESWGVWSKSHMATLSMFLENYRNENLELTVEVKPFLSERMNNLQVYVICNNAIIDRWKFEGTSVQTEIRKCQLPEMTLRKFSKTDISFYSLSAHSPKSAGMNEDNRELSIGLESLMIEHASADNNALMHKRMNRTMFFEEPLEFHSGNLTNCLGKGWSAPSSWGHWSTAAQADLAFYFWPLFHELLRLRFDMRAFVWNQNGKIEAEVSVSGQHITTWEFISETDRKSCERILKIPAEFIGDDGLINMSFDIRGNISPLELGLSQDERKLGIGIIEISAIHDDVTLGNLLFDLGYNR